MTPKKKDVTPNDIAARLVKRLEKLGLSQTAIAARMAVNVDTVHRWVKCTHAPHPGALTRLQALVEVERRKVST
jgi:DNA-binding transcriptional regulator YiaG